MTNIPNDPMMLLSFVNTKLRDEYDSLQVMCEEMGLEQAVIIDKLRTIDYEYHEDLNKFM